VVSGVRFQVSEKRITIAGELAKRKGYDKSQIISTKSVFWENRKTSQLSSLRRSPE
jgi:hypothetical protein